MVVLGGEGSWGKKGQHVPEAAGPLPSFQGDPVPTEVPGGPSR